MKTTKKYGKKIDLALSLWVKLTRAYTVVQQKAAEDIRKKGLTVPQFAVLECLGHLGELSIGELTKKQLVTGGNMTLVLDNLEKEGLIKRKRLEENRRMVKVSLTEKGKQKFYKYFLPHAQFISQLLSVLSQNEQEKLANLLKKLGKSIQKNN
ncbi:MAG: Transcriptional regulator, MarR family [Ignavibacteriae bacterium]|nr:MAG: Transcriptional regulator, MarR family [Ignavibacteriota bacterium]